MNERMKCGGHSAPRAPNEEERVFLTSAPILNLIQDAATQPKSTSSESSSSLILDPILLTTQVVAGTNYQVKYHVKSSSASADGEETKQRYVHAKIFKPLPCHNSPSELLNFKDNCSLQDELTTI